MIFNSRPRNIYRREFLSFPPYTYNHIGWKDGAARETFIVPPEVAADMSNMGPQDLSLGLSWLDIRPEFILCLMEVCRGFWGSSGYLQCE